VKKLTAIGKVRKNLREANEALRIAHAAIDHKTGEIKELEARLLEARRHTLPVGHGMDLSFLPLAVMQYQTKNELLDIHSAYAVGREWMAGLAQFEVTVLAVMDPRDAPVLYTNKKAA
jgi:hypothetical protein